MAGLKEISQVNYDQVYPNATAQTSVKVEHFIAEAKTRYAWELFRISKEAARSDGEWEIPSVLLREQKMPVVENEIDLSELNIFRSFQGDVWLANVGGLVSDCQFIRQSVNVAQVCSDDDYIGNGIPYTVIGKRIKFLRTVNHKTVPIIYASNGDDIDGDIEVDDAIGALVSDYLIKKFTNRLPEDRTANSNADK